MNMLGTSGCYIKEGLVHIGSTSMSIDKGVG